MQILRDTSVILLWRMELPSETILITCFVVDEEKNWKFFFADDSTDGKYKNGDEVPKEFLYSRRVPMNDAANKFDLALLDDDPGI